MITIKIKEITSNSSNDVQQFTNLNIIPGHPIAGTEFSGAANSKIDMFFIYQVQLHKKWHMNQKINYCKIGYLIESKKTNFDLKIIVSIWLGSIKHQNF